MRKNEYYVYIMASERRVLYVGVTNDLMRRVQEHKSGQHDGFTKKYRVNQLAYYELHSSIKEAIRREKYIKGKKREWKISLVESMNSSWEDLAS